MFPWHPGDVWEMDAESGGQKFKFTLTATAELDIDSQKVRHVEMKRDGEAVQTEGYAVDEKGIHRVAFGPAGVGKIKPPMTVLKLPLKNDATWEWKGEMESPDGTVKAEATFKLTGPEQSKVPAGTFEVWRVEQHLFETIGGQKVDVTNLLYFSPGVGIVRQETVSPDGFTEGSLVKFKPADPLTMNSTQ